MFKLYRGCNFSQKSQDMIEKVNELIDSFESQNYTLTLRQLYYQLVSQNEIENSERSYKNLGTLVTNGRLAGMISWEGIEDRNRSCEIPYVQEDEADIIGGLEYNVQMDFWARQDTYVEVWVEKEALGNVIERACQPRRVPYMSCKGYLSASEAWRAGQRFEKKIDEGKRCVLLHLGDHDPSGLDMTRDNEERLQLFAESFNIEVRRLALNMDQVHKYNPPPNPAKITDSRATGYIKKHGKSSWELDALEPSLIVKTIQKEVESFIDEEKWDECEAEKQHKREIFRRLENNWDSVKEFLERQE